MNKKVVYFGIFFIFSILIITATLTTNFKRTNKWQPAETISFSISGFDGTLDGAINQDLFRTTIQSVFDSSAPDRGHDIRQIWVSVNGIGMTFKDAIQNTDLCGIDDTTLNISNVPDPNHLGTEIEISSGKSLQDAINDGSLVKRDGGWSPCINDFKECNNPIPFCGGNNCPEDAGSDGIEFCGTYLVNNIHTGLDCTNAGGVISTGLKGYEGTDPFCIFSDFRRYFDISCPSGWTQLQYWSTTVSLTCSQLKSAYDSGCQIPCTTGSHNFDNIDPLTEACTAYMGDRDCTIFGCHCSAGPSYLCIPNKKQIGCY